MPNEAVLDGAGRGRLGCAAYAAMTRLATLPEGLAGLLAIGLVLLIRTAALRLGLRTAPISGFAPPDDE